MWWRPWGHTVHAGNCVTGEGGHAVVSYCVEVQLLHACGAADLAAQNIPEVVHGAGTPLPHVNPAGHGMHV